MPQKVEPVPCPFCGSIPKIAPWHGGPKTKRLVECDDDGCYVGPSVTGTTRAQAVKKWNVRHSASSETARPAEPMLTQNLSEDACVIWCTDPGLWWKPEAKGYTADLLQAGVFTQKDAERRARPHIDTITRLRHELVAFKSGSVGALLDGAHEPAEKRDAG